jgi:hypothetical protein
MDDIEVTDVSGYTHNTTLRIKNKNHKPESGKPIGIIIRFFEMNVSDFQSETITYMIMSRYGRCPKVLEATA